MQTDQQPTTDITDWHKQKQHLDAAAAELNSEGCWITGCAWVSGRDTQREPRLTFTVLPNAQALKMGAVYQRESVSLCGKAILHFLLIRENYDVAFSVVSYYGCKPPQSQRQ